MKIVCKKIDSEGIDLNEVTTIFSNNYDYSFGGYGLQLGTEYLVMGLVIYKESKCLYYLVDVDGRPHWFPYLLFYVSNNRLPWDWYFKLNDDNDNKGIYCIWGFDELCNQDEFYDQLANREDSAMTVYFKRKIELENDMESLY